MHIDRQCFGDTVATVSLGDTWQMDFRPLGAERSATEHMALAPGSALILASDARHRWLHGIAKRRRERLEGWWLEAPEAPRVGDVSDSVAVARPQGRVVHGAGVAGRGAGPAAPVNVCRIRRF